MLLCRPARSRRLVATVAALATAVTAATLLLAPVSSAAPAPTGAAAAGRGDTRFLAGVTAAARVVLPTARLVQHGEWSFRSALDSAQTVQVSEALLALGRRGSVLLERQVGAQTPAPATDPRPAGSVVLPVTLARPTGPRSAWVTAPAAGSGPGLTVLRWTERPGVNYLMSGRGSVTRAQLDSLARRLPADASQPSAGALAALARPAATGTTAGGTAPTAPESSFSVLSASRGYVDGAGDQTDDFGDEATLCSGCSYWHSNYAALWQGIMWADWIMPAVEVDCQFGPNTASRTRQWQAALQITQTGKLDSLTRGVADNFIVYDGPDADGAYYRYQGYLSQIPIHRHGGSFSSPYRYDVDLFDDWRGAWYGAANYWFC